MSDFRIGRGHMTGPATTPSPREDSSPARDAEDGASRSGRRLSSVGSPPPPDGKPIAERLVKELPAAGQPGPADEVRTPPPAVGGEFIGILGVAAELRVAERLPPGRLAQVMEEHLSKEGTLWKPTVTALAAAVGEAPGRVAEAYRGVARGLEGRGLSTPDLLNSRFEFVMKELLDHGAPTDAIVSAAAGWHDGLVNQRPDIDRKSSVALRAALHEGLDAAIRNHWRDTERLPAVRQAVADLLGPKALVADMVKLLQAAKPGPDLEFRLIDRLSAAFQAPRGAASPVAWVATVLESIGEASAEMDRAAPPPGKGMMVVLQAVFKALPALMDKNGELSPLASALAVGLPADRVVRAWMQAHAATLPQARQVGLAMTVLCQHDKLKLGGPALSAALEGLALGLAQPDGKAAARSSPIRAYLHSTIVEALPDVSSAYAPARAALLKALQDARLPGE